MPGDFCFLEGLKTIKKRHSELVSGSNKILKSPDARDRIPSTSFSNFYIYREVLRRF